MKRKISPEDAARQVFELQGTEEHFSEYFGKMDAESFVRQGVAIFRSAQEGIPVRDTVTDETIKKLLECLLTPEAPVPFIDGGRTGAAWRMYTQELISRIALNKDVNLAEVPPNYGESLDPRIAEEINTGELTPQQYQDELMIALNGLRDEHRDEVGY